MEVILRETIDTLGRAGQVVKVADGYARNYLLPRKLAYLVTPGNLKVIEFERQSLLKKEAKQKDDAEKLMEMLNKVNWSLAARLAKKTRCTHPSRIPTWRSYSKPRDSRSRRARSTWTITSRLLASFPFPSVSSKTSLLTSS